MFVLTYYPIPLPACKNHIRTLLKLETNLNLKSSVGSRRPSLASVHSTSSSVRSYSMLRFEKEIQQKEIRQEMKSRLARLQQQQILTQNKPQIVIGDAFGITDSNGMTTITTIQAGAIAKIIVPSTSPLTPNSTDELLPSVDESLEVNRFVFSSSCKLVHFKIGS